MVETLSLMEPENDVPPLQSCALKTKLNRQERVICNENEEIGTGANHTMKSSVNAWTKNDTVI